MAETVVGMMLSHARGLLRAHGLQTEERWPDQILEPALMLPNCLILPHISANAPEYLDLFIEDLIERLAERLASE